MAERRIVRPDRTINIGNGNYNESVTGDGNVFVAGTTIKGDVVEGKTRTERNITEDADVQNGNYVENLGGKKVNSWF